jgi:hypothetical protein
MRYFIRILVALLTFITGLALVSVLGVLQPSTNSSQSSPPKASISVAISPMEFFGWWRDKQLASKSAKEDDEALPSHTYRQLESWRAADESQPDQIDVVYSLENLGDRPVDLMVLAVCDFSISPDGLRAGSDELLRRPTLLTERQNIGQQVIRRLEPGETRELKFTGFDLKAIVDKYARKQYGALQPWELRVNIDVRTLDNRQVAEQQGHLRLVVGH